MHQNTDIDILFEVIAFINLRLFNKLIFLPKWLYCKFWSIKGTVSEELRWVLQYINRKFFSMTFTAYFKMIMLLKGHLTIRKRISSGWTALQFQIYWLMLEAAEFLLCPLNSRCRKNISIEKQGLYDHLPHSNHIIYIRGKQYTLPPCFYITQRNSIICRHLQTFVKICSRVSNCLQRLCHNTK